MKQVVITFEAGSRMIEAEVARLSIEHIQELVKKAEGEIKAYCTTDLQAAGPKELQIPDFLKGKKRKDGK